ncbi:MAG TPA: hypothetical protein VK985_08380 [Rariglobus sp.]|nr:hypothetical protein [Rariglobus sp.]
MRHFAKVYASSLIASALVIVAAAFAHKSGITSSDYIHSPLIAVQILGLAGLLITIPASLVMVIVVALQKKGAEVLCMIGCILLPFVTCGIAASINPETIVYMTQKKTPNQALQTTTRTVTPAASHPSRQRVSCLI